MKSFVISLIFFFLIFSPSLFSQSIVVEAEKGILQGVTVSNAVTGYSGSGYVTGMDNTGDKFSVIFSGTMKGRYDIVIRYIGNNGPKTQDIFINNTFYSNVFFPATNSYTDLQAFTVYFHGGKDTITVLKNWGWTDFDKLTAAPSTQPLHDYSTVVSSPVDPQINATTKNLYDFLRSMYGTKILSGQTNSYYSELVAIAGKNPIIRGFEMQNYSPHNPWGIGGTQWLGWDDGNVKAAIDWYNKTNKKGIVTFQWHWFSPSGGQLKSSTFYSDQTPFDVSRAVVPGNQEYTDALRDIDAIAVQLKRLRDADVPVLWRPLHEAGGGWFWWGAKNADACKKLYDIIYDRLTNYHQLHNLIWVWSTPEADWYPGNDKVDIIGYDSYPGDYVYGSQKKIFDDLYKLVNGEKIITMSENGPIPDVDECFAVDAPWAYFVSWSDLVASQNSTAHIQSVFTNPKVITLESNLITSVESLQTQAKLNVFPSSSNQLTVTWQTTNSEKTNLQLIDMLGRILFSQDISSNHNNAVNIQIPKPLTGVYLFMLTDKESKIISKQKVFVQ